MYFIRPTTLTDAMLFGSTVPETDYTEYAAGTTYASGDHCMVTTGGVHKVYESLKSANTGNNPPDNTTGTDPWWLDCGATNRWKIVDSIVGDQMSQSESATWILKPGLADSVALLNMEASTAQLSVSDSGTDLITNGTDWTGATGTTQPNSWSKVGDPSDFTIDSGAIKITADAANEGISQTITVEAGTEYQLLGLYRNTSGDIAQYAVYDVTHSADIKATTDLASSTVDSALSYIFTTPAGCTSIKVSLMAKSNGDIVWFDSISLNEVYYNESTNLINTVAVVDWYTYFREPITYATDLVRSDLATSDVPPFLNAVITITITKPSGTAKIGEIVVGLKRDFGSMKYGVKVGIKDYSTVEANTFGYLTIVERSYAKTLSCEIMANNTVVDELNRLLALYRAKSLVYVGSEDYSSLIVYGKYEEWECALNYKQYSLYTLDVLGLV